jgi:hypothetical protein
MPDAVLELRDDDTWRRQEILPAVVLAEVDTEESVILLSRICRGEALKPHEAQVRPRIDERKRPPCGPEQMKVVPGSGLSDWTHFNNPSIGGKSCAYGEGWRVALTEAEAFVDLRGGDAVPPMSKQKRKAARAGEEQVDPVGLEFLDVAADMFADCYYRRDGGAGGVDRLIA